MMDGLGTRSPQIGLIVPYTDLFLGGATPHWSDLAARAQLAEGVGFDSVWVPDHLLFRFLGVTMGRAWDCWSLLAALAALTSRVAFGPIVTCRAFRNPALLAKIAAIVDEISGGRLILGLGAAWNEAEYRAFGYPFDHRVSRFAKALTIVTGLPRQGSVDLTGRLYLARDCELCRVARAQRASRS